MGKLSQIFWQNLMLFGQIFIEVNVKKFGIHHLVTLIMTTTTTLTMEWKNGTSESLFWSLTSFCFFFLSPSSTFQIHSSQGKKYFGLIASFKFFSSSFQHLFIYFWSSLSVCLSVSLSVFLSLSCCTTCHYVPIFVFVCLSLY